MTYASNIPTGAIDDTLAPWWDRTKDIEPQRCVDCGVLEESWLPIHNGRCQCCAAINAGLCCHCYLMPVMHKDSDTCAACYADAINSRND